MSGIFSTNLSGVYKSECKSIHVSKIMNIKAIDIDVTCYEDKSGLSDKELREAVYDLIETERNELAMEARIAALQLMEGDTPDSIRAEWAE